MEMKERRRKEEGRRKREIGGVFKRVAGQVEYYEVFVVLYFNGPN